MSKILTFDEFDFAPDPDQTRQIYDSGFCGTIPDAAAYDSMRYNSPRFAAAFPDAVGSGAGRASLPFLAAVEHDKGFGRDENQTTGDCVSHSTRWAGSIDYSIDAMFGETSFEGRLATEPIYGYRGHTGQGASCARLAQYVSERGPGGFLPRKKYKHDGKTIDLRVYDSRKGHNWGRSGPPRWLNELADDNKALAVMSVKTLEEAIDALACGFGISMCSSFGFSNKRNKDGVSRRSGQWMHAMAWIAADATDWAMQKYGGPLILIQNSWGKWNSGGKRHNQPDGSFWITADVARAMIRGGGGWIISSVRGYNRDKVLDLRSNVASLATAA